MREDESGALRRVRAHAAFLRPRVERGRGTLSVDISGFPFRPDVMFITAGDTVTWTNRDSAQHSVLFLTGLGQSMSGTVVVSAAEGPIAVVTGGAPTFVPPTPTPIPSAGVVTRGADEGLELPANATSSSVDAGRVAVFGGIGAMVVYLIVRGSALLRRR